jgi:hypothetical protein
VTLLALLLAAAAAVLFIVEAARTRWSLLPLGLALVTLAWIAAATIEGELVRW